MKCKGSLVYIQLCQCASALLNTFGFRMCGTATACFSALWQGIKSTVYASYSQGFNYNSGCERPKSCKSAESEACRRVQCCCSASSCECFWFQLQLNAQNLFVSEKESQCYQRRLLEPHLNCVHSFSPKTHTTFSQNQSVSFHLKTTTMTHEFLFSILVL